MPSQWWSLMCMCLMMGGTPGWRPSMGPITMPFWTLEGCWLLWSKAPLNLSTWSSELQSEEPFVFADAWSLFFFFFMWFICSLNLIEIACYTTPSHMLLLDFKVCWGYANVWLCFNVLTDFLLMKDSAGVLTPSPKSPSTLLGWHQSRELDPWMSVSGATETPCSASTGSPSPLTSGIFSLETVSDMRICLIQQTDFNAFV